jgi:hypothetical protein
MILEVKVIKNLLEKSEEAGKNKCNFSLYLLLTNTRYFGFRILIYHY